jgi:hypothetical protein
MCRMPSPHMIPICKGTIWLVHTQFYAYEVRHYRRRPPQIKPSDWGCVLTIIPQHEPERVYFSRMEGRWTKHYWTLRPVFVRSCAMLREPSRMNPLDLIFLDDEAA